MSYRLLKMHWMQYRGAEKVKDFYSYHLDAGQLSLFIENFKLRESNNSEFHYSCGMRGFEKVSGTMHDQVIKSKFGIWDPDESEPT